MSRNLLAVFAILMLMGCQSSPQQTTPTVQPAPPPAPLTEWDFAAIKNSYLKANPQLKIGMVTAVLPNAHLLAVGRINMRDYSVNDVVSIVDSAGTTITMGKIEAIEHNRLEVRYQPPQNGQRDPGPGDLSIRAPQ